MMTEMTTMEGSYRLLPGPDGPDPGASECLLQGLGGSKVFSHDGTHSEFAVSRT